MKNKNEFLKMVLITFIITSGFIMLWNCKTQQINKRVLIEGYATNLYYETAKINN